MCKKNDGIVVCGLQKNAYLCKINGLFILRMALRGVIKSLQMRLYLFMQPLVGVLWTVLKVTNVLCALCVVGVGVYGLGFRQEALFAELITPFRWIYFLSLTEFLVLVVGDVFGLQPSRVWYLKLLAALLLSFVGISWLLPPSVAEQFVVFEWLSNPYLLFALVSAQAVINLSVFVTRSLHSRLNPTWIFVGSFVLLILVGTGLLMLPRSTTHSIRFIDALFTAVSAVCVTGLSTVDVLSTFTIMGQSVIAILIQLGGIGIMTFTSFFGLFFAGRHLGQNKMLIKDLVDPEKGIGQIFKTLWSIIWVTFVLEGVGAYLIFVSIGGQSWHDVGFAVFHAISAFCNAGFSIAPNGLMCESLSDNYWLHLVVALLVVLGGLGFPIIFNLGKWMLHGCRNLFRRLFGKKKRPFYIPHLLASNTLIVLTVTLVLLVGGTVVFYTTEYYNLLADKSLGGKLVTAFFMSVTPRTAGFNTFDVSQMMPMTVLWMIVFMWIGASPMSTGGGVKTTTIGIALLNVWHTLRGRDHIEIRHRRIAETTVNRAFIIIFVSLLVIVVGLMCLAWFEPHVPLSALLFEVVSAFSTVGLSMNLTPQLCDASHVVLIGLMFVGRVGLISILSCFIKPKRHLEYQYPSESIPIN